MKLYRIFYICVAIVFVLGFLLWRNQEDRMFGNTASVILAEDEQKTVSVLNFGDVMFDRGVRNIMNRGRDPFEYIKKDLDVIRKFDVVIANLEGPIVEMDRAKCQQKAYNFQFASNTPERLKSVGITMVTIANNHAYDCYNAGFVSTKNYLQKAGIEYIGDSTLEKSYVVKEIHGKKVVFIGMDHTVSPLLVSKFYPLVKKLKLENDYVVVNIHWGTEYELSQTKTQESIGHALVDSGADVVFGHHPHVIEPVEVYKGKVIFYSLGNFVFDQNGFEQNRGIGAGVEFGETENRFTVFPYVLKKFAPDFLKAEEKEAFCQEYLKFVVRDGCSFEIRL